jgi:NAD(P)H-nitrite reductase large subunit
VTVRPCRGTYYVVVRGVVQLLNAEEKEAVLRGGQRIRFEKCLIATGGTPWNRLPGHYEPGKQVSTFRDVRCATAK